MPLFRDEREDVRLERWAAAATVALDASGGAEIVVLDGGFAADGERFERLSWLRLPVASRLQARAGPQGCNVWVKTGHLRRIDTFPADRGAVP